MKDRQKETLAATDLHLTKTKEEKLSNFDKDTDKRSDKAVGKSDKRLTKLVSLGEVGAVCQIVDGKMICD